LEWVAFGNLARQERSDCRDSVIIIRDDLLTFDFQTTNSADAALNSSFATALFTYIQHMRIMALNEHFAIEDSNSHLRKVSAPR
jgi:hypothetical protein